MKKRLHTLLALCLLTTSCNGVTRTVRVTVTGEDGTPIKDADVGIYFLGYDLNKDKEVAGFTNDLGVFSATDKAVLRMETSIAKDGYYKTHSGRLRRTQDHDVTFVLREKRNPIPLHAKKYRGKLPGLSKKFGFDFQAGDWVAPHGEGQTVDALFKATIIRDKNSNKISGEIEITFDNEGEGISIVNSDTGYNSLSELVMPHQAPLGLYEKSISRLESGYENKSKPRNTSYFFRTRKNKISAGKTIYNYTKFNDGFNFVMGGGEFLKEPYRKRFPKEYAMVDFTYYFNPTPNDRNLEFDPKRNLLTNLEYEERANQP
jgi:hypothetical protein